MSELIRTFPEKTAQILSRFSSLQSLSLHSGSETASGQYRPEGIS